MRKAIIWASILLTAAAVLAILASVYVVIWSRPAIPRWNEPLLWTGLITAWWSWIPGYVAVVEA